MEAAFIDHGTGGTGETTTIMPRPGNAGSNTAADHIAVVKRALGQPPPQVRTRVLTRADSAAGTKKLLKWLAKRNLAYTTGFTIDEQVQQAIRAVPAIAWAPAYNSDGNVRNGAWAAEITGMLTLARLAHGDAAPTRRRSDDSPAATLTFT